MEVFLRLILLIIAAGIVFLILFEANYRRRQADANRLAKDAHDNVIMINPDEILGLDPREPIINITHKNDIKSDSYPSFTSLETEIDILEKEPELIEATPVTIEEPAETPPPSKTTTSWVKSGDLTRDLIVLSVVAKPGCVFASYDLLQSIAAAGMQFGDMNIFHYSVRAEQGRVTLFSLASATEPGEFNMDHIGDFSCAGLTLFTNLAAVPNPQEAFTMMLKAAEQLADDLDGILRSGNRVEWNDVTLQQYQQKVSQYETSTPA